MESREICIDRAGTAQYTIHIYIYIYIKMRVSGLLQYLLQRLMQPYEIEDRYKSKASVLHIEST